VSRIQWRIKKLRSETGQRDEVVAGGRVREVQADPVARRERDVVVHEGVGRGRLDRQHRELQRLADTAIGRPGDARALDGVTGVVPLVSVPGSPFEGR
jgi:hypothetical protein